MLSECPHCLTRMIPKADGTCPACQRNTRDTSGTDPTRTSLHVAQGDQLPAICCLCGLPADRYTVVHRTSAAKDDQPSVLIQAVTLLFSWPLALYMFVRGLNQRSIVKVRMPHCQACVRTGRIEPRYVDFEHARMTFVVHQHLKQAQLQQARDI